MAQILEYIRSDIAFDPETIIVLGNAFDDAWKKIEASDRSLARGAYANAMREVIAKYIIDMARGGEREPRKLSDGAIQFLDANYKA